MHKQAALLMALALGVTLTSGVVAVAAANATSVKACVDRHHFLATASKHKCPKGTHALTLGLKGPRGLQGPRGLAGTDAESTAIVGTYLGGALSDTFTAVVAISQAPAGSYTITYDYTAEDEDSAGATPTKVLCGLYTQGQFTQQGTDVTLVPGQLAELSGTTVGTLSAAGPIEVKCAALSTTLDPTSVSSFAGDLVATETNKIIAPS